jgi:AhpD family alkylhydroperoxidase
VTEINASEAHPSPIHASSPRIDVFHSAPAAVKALLGVEQYVAASGLERPLLLLVKLRASYINGCSFCVDMHSKDARAAGESEQRLFAVPVWHETPFFTPRERAALAWTERVTSIALHGVPDAAFHAAREHFTERELVDLTMAIVAINAWNRMAVSFAAVPGSYQAPKGANATASNSQHLQRGTDAAE